MTAPRSTPSSRRRTPIRQVALAVGVVFLLVGVLGFIPGVTSNYDDLALAGTDSRAELFGLFRVSVLHNAVHLAFGVLGIFAARTVEASRIYLVGGGATYLLLWVYGTLIDESSDANFVPLNSADNVLHFFLGVGMVVAGVLLWRNARTPLGH